MRHLVVCAANLEREDALLVFALQPDTIAETFGQRRRKLERGLDCDVVNLRGQDLLQIVDWHCGPPRLRLSPLRCPPRGSNSRLGAALRRSWTPTLAANAAALPPRGGLIRALGRPCCAHVLSRIAE